MKLACDVCEKAVATLLCCADEAALCPSCDSRVHAANKLAGRHERLPLVGEGEDEPPPPSCDICQERSALFFCVEDRALLCRDCDSSIHRANALAAKHRRMLLLTRLRIGTTATNSSSSPSSTSTATSASLRSTESDQHHTAAEARLPGHILPNVHGEKPTKTATVTTDSVLRSDIPFLKSIPHLSIQRLSSGSISFIAPVLSSLQVPSLYNQKNTDNSVIGADDILEHISANHTCTEEEQGNGNDDDDNNNGLDFIFSPPSSSTSAQHEVPEYFSPSELTDWKLDDMLTDLDDMCESGQPCPLDPKESSVSLGLGEQELRWFASCDFLEEEIYQSQGVAQVPEIHSPRPISWEPTCSFIEAENNSRQFRLNKLYDIHIVPNVEGSPLVYLSSIQKKRKVLNSH